LQQDFQIKKSMIPTGTSYNTGKNFVEAISQAIYHFNKGPKLKTVINEKSLPTRKNGSRYMKQSVVLLSWTMIYSGQFPS
jgi:hypothetical protein